MTLPLILSGITVLGLPLLLLFVINADAAIMFFAACGGIVLLTSLDPAVVSTAGALVPGDGEDYIRLTVVVLALVFSALVFKGSTRRPANYVIHFILVLATSVMLWTFLPRLTGVSWLVDGTSSSVWQTLDDFKSLIVATGLVASLLVILKNRG